jgi:hypothetical protein
MCQLHRGRPTVADTLLTPTMYLPHDWRPQNSWNITDHDVADTFLTTTMLLKHCWLPLYIYWFIGVSNVPATSWPSVMCQLCRDHAQCLWFIVVFSNVSVQSSAICQLHCEWGSTIPPISKNKQSPLNCVCQQFRLKSLNCKNTTTYDV